MAFADAWRLIRTIDKLIQSDADNRRTFAELQVAIAGLDRRITRLESREDIVAIEARSAARTGASDAMQGVILKIGQRLGALENLQPQIPRHPPTTRMPSKPKPE